MSKVDDGEKRLYFIVRSWIMGQIGSIILFIFILILGTVNFIQAVIIGGFGFVASLVISRYCENYIENLVKKILEFLNKYKGIKKIILKYF